MASFLQGLLPRHSPGFQGAERTTVKISIYNREGSAFSLLEGNQIIDFDGRLEDGVPAVTGCSVQNSLGAGGQFQISLWVDESFDAPSSIEVDAWCDISFCRNGTCWHVMRGIIDEVRQRRQVSGSGATSIMATITGRSFQAAFEKTNATFFQLIPKNYHGDLRFRVTSNGLINGPPNQNVETILFKLFDLIGSLGSGNWTMPSSMPGKTGSVSSAVLYDADFFDTKTLKRATHAGNMLFPSTPLWDVASQMYADGQFCELYTDLLPNTGLRGLAYDSERAEGLAPEDSRMAVVFRDKPFPRVDPKGLGALGKASPYFSLPMWQVGRQEVTSIDMGTNSLEVRNYFTCIGDFFAETSTGLGALKNPLYRDDDRKRRGVRLLDGTSVYDAVTGLGNNKYITFQGRRARLRDWYCMGAELRSGSISLWRTYPQMHVGGRIRVRGGAPEEDFTGYIEAIRHQWSAQQGARTEVDYTRGWRGTDDQLLARLTRISSAYREGQPSATLPG